MLLTNSISQVYSAILLMTENKKRHGCAGVMFLEHKRQRSKLLLIAHSDLWPVLHEDLVLHCPWVTPSVPPLFCLSSVPRFLRVSQGLKQLLWCSASVQAELHLQFLYDRRMAGRGGRWGLPDRCTTGFCFGSPLILLTDRHV